VDGPRPETGSGTQTGVRSRRILVGFSQQPHHALASRAAIFGCAFDAEPRREPDPEAPQELPAPATKATPAPPDRSSVHLEPEANADFALGAAVDEVKPEGFEDHRPRVPATGVEQVGQDADRLLAAPAEVAPDRDLVLVLRRHDAEDLPPVDAVAHDAEPVGAVGQVPAPGAALGPERLDRRESGSKVEQLIDRPRQRS
jgi:hypothetical protein